MHGGVADDQRPSSARRGGGAGRRSARRRRACSARRGRRGRRCSCGSSRARSSRRPRSSWSAVSSWLTGSKYGIHRAADVHQQEEPHVVLPRRAEHHLDLAGVAAGLVDGLVEVELGRDAGARQLAQAAQRDAHLADVEGDVGAVVAEAPLARRPSSPSARRPGRRRGCRSGAAPPWPNGERPPVPTQRLPPSWRSFCSASVSRKRRISSSERQALERGELLGGQLREVLRILQPLEHLVGDVVERALDAVEDAREDAVVGVEVGLALHQAGAARGGRSAAGSSRAGPARAPRGASSTPASRRARLRRAARRRGRGTSTPSTGCSAGPRSAQRVG